MAGTDSPNQAERFERAARELGVEVDERKLKETLRKIAPAKPEPSADDDSKRDG